MSFRLTGRTRRRRNAFHWHRDSNGYDKRIDEAVGYATGTLIRSECGDVAIECLKAGDLVVTYSGALRAIRRLHRAPDCRKDAHPHKAMSVRIAAHAFGPNRPARNLFVSSEHLICVDILGEVLIPAFALINGATITQVEVEKTTYWNVELDSHDVVLAENLPAESYADTDNQACFVGDAAVGIPALRDASLQPHTDNFPTYFQDGLLVGVVRAQIRARALTLGWSLSTALEAYLEVDGVRVDPVVHDGAMRFLVPAGAKDVWLVSPAARPCDTLGTDDSRFLGIDLVTLRILDGFEPRSIRLDDPRLRIGFSQIEDGAHRWTEGRARLPADLWDACCAPFFLHIAGYPAPRWVAPQANQG